MWIRINDFIINLDNVTNINIVKEYVYISFNHAATQLGQAGTDNNIYWNSLRIKKEDIPVREMRFIENLPTEN